MYSKQQIIDTLNSEDIFIDNFLLEAFIKNWKIEPIYENAEGIEFFDDMAVEKIKNGIIQKQPKCEINIVDKNTIKPVDMSVEAANINTCPPSEADIVIEAEQVEVVTEQTQVSENSSQDNYQELSKESSQEEFVEQIVENKPEETESFVESQQDVIEPEVIQGELSNEALAVINEVNREIENEIQNVTLDISNQTLTILAESIARKITSDVSEFIKRTDLIEDAVQLGEYKKDNEILLQKIEELITDNKLLIEKIRELEKENQSYVKLFGNVYTKNK